MKCDESRRTVLYITIRNMEITLWSKEAAFRLFRSGELETILMGSEAKRNNILGLRRGPLTPHFREEGEFWGMPRAQYRGTV